MMKFWFRSKSKLRFRSRSKSRFRFAFASVFMSLSLLVPAPTLARVCMVSDPAILVTHDQLDDRMADPVDITNCTFDIYSPKYDSTSAGNIGTAWSVSKSGNTKEDLKCTVTGVSVCSSAGGTFAVKGSPSNSVGSNCWCKMTSPRVGAWVFIYDHGSAAGCAANCANRCANFVLYNGAFRAAVLALP